MFAFDASNSKLFASVFALGASAFFMAMAIVPASPAGLLV